jgi:hypothetical protein
MSRSSVAFQDQLLWVEVSLAQPCRVCGAISVCTILESGEFAHCSVTVSEWPVLDGGWLHRLDVSSTQPAAVTSA